jgi:hypothetical protein
MATIGAGQQLPVSFNWPGELMGDDGPKALVAQAVLPGAVDVTPSDNIVTQVVTVGP